jgi:hypothetical protein
MSHCAVILLEERAEAAARQDAALVQYMAPVTVAALERALECSGVVFIEQNGSGPGVRLRDPVRPQID